MTESLAAAGKQVESRSGRRRTKPAEGAQRQEHLNPRLELWLVIGLAAIYLGWFARPLWWSASESARLVGTFNTDEEAHVMLLKEAIDNRFPRLGYHQYGYAYLNMGLLPLFLLSYFTDVTAQHIVVWLRMIPTLFAIATVALTFLMACRYFGRLAAWLSAYLLSFTVLSFLELSAMSHPDIPQLFFLMLGIYFCCRLAEDGRLKWLIWASVAAGFAFGCKYSGLFLLPIIGLSGVLQTILLDKTQIRVNSDQVVKVSRLLATLVGAGLLVLGAVVIPYAAAPYIDAEYYGVSIPQLFNALRVISLVAGVGLVLLAVVPFVWTFVRRPKLAYLVQMGMLSAATFALAFFVTSPFNVFSVRAGFWRGFLYESLHASFGHGFRAQGDWREWLRILSSPELVAPFVLVLAIVSLALTAYGVVKEGWQVLLQPEGVMWGWTLGYLGFLLWRVNVRTHRSMLPLVPFILILSTHSLQRMLSYGAARVSRRLLPLMTISALLIVLGVVFLQSLDRLLEFRQETSHRVQSSTAVEAGEWLEAHYPPSARVLYDPYSYVPPTFADAHVTPWGGTPQLLETLRPDVVIVHSFHSDRFSDPGQAGAYAREETQFLARYDYYATLRNGKAGYTLLRDFGSVQVYGRRGD